MAEVGIFILIFFGVLIFQISRQNTGLCTVRLMPSEKKNGSQNLWNWAEANDFEISGNYICPLPAGTVFISAWKHRTRPVFLSAYKETAATLITTIDIVTVFTDDYVLTTCNRNTHTASCLPKTYKQDFPKAAIETLWQKHTEAEAYLLSEGIRESRGPIEFRTCFEDYISREARYRRRNPFFPLQSLYGYFVGRHFWANLPLQKQAEKRRVVRPSENSWRGCGFSDEIA